MKNADEELVNSVYDEIYGNKFIQRDKYLLEIYDDLGRTSSGIKLLEFCDHIYCNLMEGSGPTDVNQTVAYALSMNKDVWSLPNGTDKIDSLIPYIGDIPS